MAAWAYNSGLVGSSLGCCRRCDSSWQAVLGLAKITPGRVKEAPNTNPLKKCAVFHRSRPEALKGQFHEIWLFFYGYTVHRTSLKASIPSDYSEQNQLMYSKLPPPLDRHMQTAFSLLWYTASLGEREEAFLRSLHPLTPCLSGSRDLEVIEDGLSTYWMLCWRVWLPTE